MTLRYRPSYEDYAWDRTKTRRKDARRAIRNTLGAGSDDAPTIATALDAAMILDGLMGDASAGRFHVRVLDTRGNGTYMKPVEALYAVKADRDAKIDANVESAEPAPGYVIRGRYADGSFRLFERADDGAQEYVAAFPTYDMAQERARERSRS